MPPRVAQLATDMALISTPANPARSRPFAGASDFMYAGAATPDGKVVIAGGQDGILRLWNGATGTSIATFEPPKPPTPEPQKTAAAK